MAAKSSANKVRKPAPDARTKAQSNNRKQSRTKTANTPAPSKRSPVKQKPVTAAKRTRLPYWVGLLLVALLLVPDGLREHGRVYDEILNRIDMERARWSGESVRNEQHRREIAGFWQTALSEWIFPAWYGTPWGFSGTTARPAPQPPLASLLPISDKRKIACGHFVGAVMADLGFDVDRYRLGRQASSNIIHTFVQDRRLIKHFHGRPHTDVWRWIRAMGPGLYIVGLDTHAGFLIVEPYTIDFIHAAGRYPFAVLREPARESASIAHSEVVMLGKFSDDAALIDAWVEGRRIAVKGRH